MINASGLVPSAGTLADVDPRRRLLDRFAQAEAQFLHRQNDAFIDAMWKGEFGHSMRARITAERDVQAKWEKAQFQGSMGVLLGGLAGFASGGPVRTSPPFRSRV